jgi:hypothetical protein
MEAGFSKPDSSALPPEKQGKFASNGKRPK